MFKFEKLKVWQKAIDLSQEVHECTLSWGKEELYVLTSQIKRAADSIALNIAEGSTGQSDSEQNRFLGYALRSAIEVVSCFHLARKRGLITSDKFDVLYLKLEEIIKMLQAFRNKLKGGK